MKVTDLRDSGGRFICGRSVSLTPEHRSRIAASHIGITPNLSSRAKMAETARRRQGNFSGHNRQLSKLGRPTKLSDAHKEAVSRGLRAKGIRPPSRKGAKHKPETLALYREQRCGLPSPMEGRKHRPESNHKNRLAHLGKVQSEETVSKRMAKLNAWPRPQTVLESLLYAFLEEANIFYEPQKRFGRYLVDAYLPAYNLAFEADGDYWHTDKAYDQKRDAYLLAKGILAVVHLEEETIRQWSRKEAPA